MGIDTRFDSPGNEKRSIEGKKRWKEDGPSKIACDNIAQRAKKMFSEKGMSIAEITEELGHSRCSTVAKYLRGLGFNIPYYGNSRSRHKRLSNIDNSEEFYGNMRVQDLEA